MEFELGFIFDEVGIALKTRLLNADPHILGSAWFQRRTGFKREPAGRSRNQGNSRERTKIRLFCQASANSGW
jgi:hypothetical protein